MAIEACLYNIQIIGEAVNQLADDVKANNPDIPWNLIKGMRNRLIHEYFGTDLPGLKLELKSICSCLQRGGR